ncbi:dihydrolipoyl dehydrogenase [Acidocella aquatica]|uniref:Dihydrolipoyl dehydrogenase n=1 Tax=Acidocella aquatica TaxID=1922313 RepID=A0ABQ6A8X3_9PROT|nr:dihydrolipoyl dehydrogenase [Acidocella aquatica]GLR68935.1 dihydrolipoyl dehydrogenase [Acidocella aquatica]
MADEFDLIVVGGGPGGYVAAIRAAQLKLKVAVVEAKHLGGICLNWGCIPTKALLRSSEVNHLLHNLGEFGFSADNIQFDLDKIVKRSRGVSKQLSSGIAHLLKKNKVTVVDGFGRLTGGGHLAVSGADGKPKAMLHAPHIILATGARPRQIPGIEADGKLIWSYFEAMVPAAMPKSLLVIGSGAIGIEFASFYRNMGAEVTVVEMLDRVLPVEDAEISALARKSFEKQGMKIITSANVKGVVKGADNVTVTVEAGGKEQQITVDRVISAAGIVGNVENLGLEGTKVKVERTHIVVDGFGRTGEPGVYAIGDVAGPPWLAHKASHEGVVCVEYIAGKNPHPFETGNIPGCTYCRPQVASVGLTEAKAKEAGYELKIGRFPFIGNGKAIAMGEPEGLIKTIFDAKTGAMLGAHMIGAEVTEMIQGYVIARQLETTEAELMHTVFPHPTISEAMHESVLDAYGQVIHF